MTDDSERLRRALDARVERWTQDAKKLLDAGKEDAAFDLYRRAAEEMPGAPWLQHRTAELARKLAQPELAIGFYRRAALAFQLAEFSKRAVAPLRTAWTLALGSLPTSSRSLLEVSVELMELHRRLGFAADAQVVFERTNAALRARGFAELPGHLLESVPPRSAAQPLRASAELPKASSSLPSPASSSAPAAESAPSARSRALARLLGRR